MLTVDVNWNDNWDSEFWFMIWFMNFAGVHRVYDLGHRSAAGRDFFGCWATVEENSRHPPGVPPPQVGVWEGLKCSMVSDVFGRIEWNERKNRVILTWKIIESVVKIKFDSVFRVIGEYLSQIDSILRVNLTQIFFNYSKSQDEFQVSPLTKLFRSKWLNLFFQFYMWKKTLKRFDLLQTTAINNSFVFSGQFLSLKVILELVIKIISITSHANRSFLYNITNSWYSTNCW